MFVQEIKLHAINHYENDGWDFVVETMSDDDILEIVKDCHSYGDAIETMLDYIAVLHNYRSELQKV